MAGCMYMPRRGTTSTSSPSEHRKSALRSCSQTSTQTSWCADTRTCSSTEWSAASASSTPAASACPMRTSRARTGRSTSSPGGPRTMDRRWPRRRATRHSSSSPSVDSELVSIGRVGRPHGLDGSFFVEGASEREGAFKVGTTVQVDGGPATIVGSKHGAQGRPVIKLDRTVSRGSTLAVPRDELPELDDDEYYTFQLVGLVVEEEGGPVI